MGVATLGRNVPVPAVFLGRLYQRIPDWNLFIHRTTNRNLFSYGWEDQMPKMQPVPPGASVLGMWTSSPPCVPPCVSGSSSPVLMRTAVTRGWGLTGHPGRRHLDELHLPRPCFRRRSPSEAAGARTPTPAFCRDAIQPRTPSPVYAAELSVVSLTRYLIILLFCCCMCDIELPCVHPALSCALWLSAPADTRSHARPPTMNSPGPPAEEGWSSWVHGGPGAPPCGVDKISPSCYPSVKGGTRMSPGPSCLCWGLTSTYTMCSVHFLEFSEVGVETQRCPGLIYMMSIFAQAAQQVS